MNKILLLFLLVGCSLTPPKPEQTLVLISDLHVSEDIWTEVIPHLEVPRFNVINLGRLGRDTEEAPSLSLLAELSCQKIPSKSVLVAHSFGGAIANRMVGVCPDKIERIIYVTALTPQNKEKPLDHLNRTDQRNYSKIVTFGRFKIVPKDALSFYQGAAPELSQEKYSPLHSEWISLISEAMTYNEENFNKIPKSYISTQGDPLLSVTTQFKYMSRLGIKDVQSLKSDHYPMLSHPKELSQMITGIVLRSFEE